MISSSHNKVFSCLGRNRSKSAWQRAPLSSQPAGLSLLEVILALAILGVACTFMAQSMQLATSNALAAHRQAEAEIAAESILSQVIAGVIPMQPSASWIPVGISASTSNWSYMLSSVNCEVENMVGIQIDMRDETEQDSARPSDFKVIRWIIDPAMGLDTPPDESATSETSGQAGATGQTGASTGGLNGKM